MSLLYEVVSAHRCRSTHHHIALNAVMRIADPRARDFLLKHHQALLDGAKAPDTKFKDFKNHVYHVGDNGWGGAPKAAAVWYGQAVEALNEKDWSGVAWSLGVMSHYVADPVQPFHTGQTEEEGAMHRALEWSIAKSHDRIRARIAASGYPSVAGGDGADWVQRMVIAGAERSHPHYQTFLDHYDLKAGVASPPDGLDETLLDVISDLVAYATAGLTHLFERAFAEADVKLPRSHLTAQACLAHLDIPIRSLLKRIDDGAARRQVSAMYAEFQRTGKVIETLPDDDKAIRALHAEDVLGVELASLDRQALKPIGTRYGQPLQKQALPAQTAPPEAAALARSPTSTPEPKREPEEALSVRTPPKRADAAATHRAKPNLAVGDPVEAAPSIGPKTAARLDAVGVRTVGELLAADPEATANRLAVRHIRAQDLRDWQDQARLVMAVPRLRGHDAQILVGANIRSAEALATAPAADVLNAALQFLGTKKGAWVRRGNTEPDREEVDAWVASARDAA